jgi:pyrimidine-specific ribonucleoside hydrolase
MTGAGQAAVDVLIDVDTGVDDALALLLATRSAALAVRAVTCVAGNVDLDQVVVNTLKVVDAAGALDIPVARGHDRPLLGPRSTGRSLHGADGLADLGLPDPMRAPVNLPAGELQRAVLTRSDPAQTLVALGPLTNVAAVLTDHPDVRDRIARIVLLGGEVHATGFLPAGFNLREDPEALEIVVASGIPLLAYPMDVFFTVTLDRADAEGLAMRPEPGAQLAGRLLLHQVERFGGVAGMIGDAGAVACLIDPAGYESELVELAGSEGGPRLEVVRRVDVARYRRLFVRTIAGAPVH